MHWFESFLIGSSSYGDGCHGSRLAGILALDRTTIVASLLDNIEPISDLLDEIFKSCQSALRVVTAIATSLRCASSPFLRCGSATGCRVGTICLVYNAVRTERLLSVALDSPPVAKVTRLFRSINLCLRPLRQYAPSWTGWLLPSQFL